MSITWNFSTICAYLNVTGIFWKKLSDFNSGRF